MRIVEVTHRHRNDFHFDAVCEHCGKKQHYKDGYADNFYCTRVIPGRFCPEDDCGKNSYGDTEEEHFKKREEAAK